MPSQFTWIAFFFSSCLSSESKNDEDYQIELYHCYDYYHRIKLKSDASVRAYVRRSSSFLFFSCNGKVAIVVYALLTLLEYILESNEGNYFFCNFNFRYSSMNLKILIFLFCSNFLLLYSTTGQIKK
jgi:hypothetical protein